MNVNAINSLSMTGKQKPSKFNGKTHSRQDELKAYRKTIAMANEKMIDSVMAGDYEAADRFSRMIDNSQGKILEIINQEDGHSYKQIDNYSKLAHDTLDFANEAVKIGGKAAIVATPGANVAAQIGEKLLISA